MVGIHLAWFSGNEAGIHHAFHVFVGLVRRIRVVILHQIIFIISLTSPYITLLQPYNLSVCVYTRTLLLIAHGRWFEYCRVCCTKLPGDTSLHLGM